MSRKIQDIDVKTLVFSKQKINSVNRFLYVYSDKKPLVIKLDISRLPFGLNKDTLSKKSQYILDYSMEGNPDSLKAFEELDEAVIKKCNEEFFPEKSFEEVKDSYTSCIKYPDNPRFFPTLRTKIIIDDEGKPKCDFYDSQKSEGKYPKIDVVSKGNESYLLERIGKSSKVEGIVECIGLWFFGNKFGLSFKTTQLLLHPKAIENVEVDNGCQFIESDSDTSNSEGEFIGE